MNQIAVDRKYKNNLFVYLFTKIKKYALSLYNAVNGSHYTNEEDLQFKLLEDVLFIEMKNDVSFLFDGALNLYEHQSTFSYNMPLRGLFYLADLYRKLIPMERLYRKKRIRIPTPKYIVFYNGPVEDMKVDRLEMKLSDAFEVSDESMGFEWTATVLNINPGFNDELFGQCEILREYARFVEVVKRNAETMDINMAMVAAIDECLKEGTLVDFLQEYGKEMEQMSWGIYDTERILQIQHEEALEDALAEGIERGRKEREAELEIALAEGLERGREQGRKEREAELEIALAEGIERGRKEREAELEIALAEGLERGREQGRKECEAELAESEHIISLLQQKIKKLEGQLALRAR